MTTMAKRRHGMYSTSASTSLTFGVVLSLSSSLISLSSSFSLSKVPLPATRRGKLITHKNTLPSTSITTTTNTPPPLFSSLIDNDIINNEDLLPGMASIDASNPQLSSLLAPLRSKDFFRLYSCDMLGSCEYMPQELFECYSQSCEIYPVDDEDVPPALKAVDADEHDFELDGWARWDMPSDDYYSTTQFPEEFTGYDGSDVWMFIHDRICFNEVSEDDKADADNWKTDFNKAVSGLHAMISAQVVKGIADKIEMGEDVSEERWTDPVVEFRRRLSPQGETPHAVENLYFCYMLVLTAVSKAKDRLLQDCASGKIDADAAQALRLVLDFPLLDDETIEVASVKLHDHAVKDECAVTALWEARMRTRELMRIMNCVQCNKCRLHGKISVLGLSTAMQILLGRAGDGGDVLRIHRVELAALITTMSKFATAVETCTKMSKAM